MLIHTKQRDAFTSLVYVYGVDDHAFLDLNYSESTHTVNHNYFSLRNVSTFKPHIVSRMGLLVIGTRYFKFKNKTILHEVSKADMSEHAIKFLNSIKHGVYVLLATLYPYGLKDSECSYTIPKYESIVASFINLLDFISLEDAYANVYNMLIERNLIEVNAIPCTDLDKIKQHGFDKNISFRHRK